MYEKEIEQLQEMIDESNRIVFFGGAGVSTEGNKYGNKEDIFNNKS